MGLFLCLLGISCVYVWLSLKCLLYNASLPGSLRGGRASELGARKDGAGHLICRFFLPRFKRLAVCTFRVH